MYAAQLGWLSSTVKYKQGKKDETSSKSEYYGHDSLLCRTPELDQLSYLAALWDELGRYQSSGMGISTTGWTEIKHYSEMVGISKWEGQLLHSMSKVFVDARNMFSDLFCEPPYLYGGFDFRLLSADAADRRRKK
ncbi:hypothetical protein NVP1276O_30 [Vibrio phage 1.276.O._10N.286.54.E4]|nr:hypothetical protein NVP1276O_30 [Vibrio phage 1.276.O._10N.286.54.E4]